MILSKYQEFLNNFKINENVQNAKNFLKKRALAAKKEKTKKDNETLTPEEIRKAESDPNFVKIREMLKDNLGYVYLFTKFLFDEEVPFEELKTLYSKLKEFKQFLGSLPMQIDKYSEVVPDASDARPGFERLSDDLEKLKRQRITKKWVDKLYSHQKAEYASAPATIKEKIDGIASSFEEFGKNSDGSKDEQANKTLQDLFFDKLRRYKDRPLNEVIQAALSFIKAANNSSISKFYQSIQNCNRKFGDLNGAEIVYDDHGILILEIKSFQANKELNSNTSHCIASTSYQWDSYVGKDDNFNKQYYIYNFNLTTADDKSVIGITIGPKYAIRACHLKSDAGFSDRIKAYMTSIKVPFEVLAPMTDEEIEKKKKRVKANKEIIKSNISLEKCKQYIEEGADPNAQQGKPLINSVEENDYERTKYLLSVGAMPNIGGAIKGAQNLQMIKLLVDHGATLTAQIFQKVVDDYDAIKYLIDAGMDVNFEQGMPLREAAKKGRLDIMELLVDNGAIIDMRRYMVVKWAAEWGKGEILKYLFGKMKELNKIPEERSFNEWIDWSKSSDKIDENEKKKITALLLDEKKKLLGK